MHIPSVLYDELPQWYFISYDGSTVPAIRIGIYEDVADELPRVARKHHAVDDLFFETDLRRGFGHDRIGIYEATEDGYVMLRFPLDKTLLTHECATALSILFSSLSVVRDLSGAKFRADCRYRQLVELSTGLSEGETRSAPMSGHVSAWFSRWLEQQVKADRDFSAVEEAMASGWKALATFELKSIRGPRGMGIQFLTMAANGGFVMQTVGNACDVSTDEWWDQIPGFGHRLVDHNLDSPTQQLSLLCGFGALFDMARTESAFRPTS